MRHANVLILTDEADFARLLTACWQAAPNPPGITVFRSELHRKQERPPHDLVVLGPLRNGKISSFLSSLDRTAAIIICGQADSRELGKLRTRFPRLVHIPMREDWAETILLVAGESLRCTEALRQAKQAESFAVKNERYATLGRYIMQMKYNVNNALTSILGNAELLLLEPGQLSSGSLEQIKIIHSMALRINEVMLRFSTLATEMREPETSSQAETEELAAPSLRRR